MDISMFFILFFSCIHHSYCKQIAADSLQIDGKIDLNSVKDGHWISEVNIMAHSNHGKKFNGYIRYDNTFVINCLPAGSYVVEVVHPVYEFQPARVDVYPKTKPKAFEVFYANPNRKYPIPYPLVFKEWKKSNFFETRNQTEIADIMKNPMLIQLMPMVATFILILYMQQIMPMQSPEALQELRNYQQRANMFSGSSFMNFDLSEWLADFFYKPPTKDGEKPRRQTTGKRNPTIKKKRNRTVKESRGLFNWIKNIFFNQNHTPKEERNVRKGKKSDTEKAETGVSREMNEELDSLEANKTIKESRLSKQQKDKTRKRKRQSGAAAVMTSAEIDAYHEDMKTGERSKYSEEGNTKSRKRKKQRQKKRIPQK